MTSSNLDNVVNRIESVILIFGTPLIDEWSIRGDPNSNL